MRKKLALISSLSLTLLVALSWVEPVQASIEDWMWIEPTFRGFDDFYGTSVIAYTQGSTAELAVTLNNVIPMLPDVLNVSAVIVGFDWAINYSSTEVSMNNPYQLNASRPRHTFTVTFTVPSTSVASNMFLHTYTIYVEYVNATTGPKERIGTFSVSSDSFAVYSSDQGIAVTINKAIGVYYTTLYPYPFVDVEADVLYNRGYAEFALADNAYANGDFTTARTRFEAASSLLDEAFAKESERWSASQQAETNADSALANYYNALASLSQTEASAATKEADAAMIEANATKIQADAAMAAADAALTNAYGWLAFGIGWMFIGVGVIVYGLRRPPRPPA